MESLSRDGLTDIERSNVLDALKRNGCFVPSLCKDFPYTCGCGFLIRCKFQTVEAIERLAKGLSIGSEIR